MERILRGLLIVDYQAVQDLGGGLYRQSLTPYTPKERKHTLIFGLDTEYRVMPRGNRLICWQLTLNEHWKVIPTELTWETLYAESLELAREAGVAVSTITQFVYGVFFSTAECQWLDYLASKIEIFGAHHINLRYPVTQRRSLYIFDVATWFPEQNLSSVAKLFGLEKLEYDVSNLTRDNLNDKAFIEYARNDAYITGEVLRQLRQLQLDDSGIDILLTKTPASTAGAEFRSKFIKREAIGEKRVKVKAKDGKAKGTRLQTIYKHHGQGDCALRRRNLWSSWGGRKEVFYRGYKKRVYYYDAHSFYPNCAKQMGILPLENDWYATENENEWLKAKGGFGKVGFQFPQGTNYPCLPVLIDNKLCFPLAGVSNCTTWEARLAKTMGAQLTLLKGYYYNNGVTWFAEYEAAMIAKRKATDNEALRAIYKALSNNIIGKLTQKRVSYDINEVADWASERELPLSFAMQCENLPLEKKLSTGSLFYPEWNTLILGYARAIVAKAIIKTSALQVATDGIYCEGDYGQELVVDGIVFDLRDCGDYVCYRPGLYRLGKALHHQAISLRVARQVLKEYKPKAKVADEVARITSLREAIRLDEPLGKVTRQKLVVGLAYDGKRILRADGYTEPLPSIEHLLEATAEI